MIQLLAAQLQPHTFLTHRNPQCLTCLACSPATAVIESLHDDSRSSNEDQEAGLQRLGGASPAAGRASHPAGNCGRAVGASQIREFSYGINAVITSYTAPFLSNQWQARAARALLLLTGMTVTHTQLLPCTHAINCSTASSPTHSSRSTRSALVENFK